MVDASAKRYIRRCEGVVNWKLDGQEKHTCRQTSHQRVCSFVRTMLSMPRRRRPNPSPRLNNGQPSLTRFVWRVWWAEYRRHPLVKVVALWTSGAVRWRVVLNLRQLFANSSERGVSRHNTANHAQTARLVCLVSARVHHMLRCTQVSRGMSWQENAYGRPFCVAVLSLPSS